MPQMDVEITARRRRLTRDRSVSMPVNSNSSKIPIWEIASIMLLSAGVSGNITCRRPGISAPNSEGPSNTPARSWPNIAGCPNRFMTSPSRRPKNSNNINSAAKIAVVCAVAIICSASHRAQRLGHSIERMCSQRRSPSRCSPMMTMIGTPAKYRTTSRIGVSFTVWRHRKKVSTGESLPGVA